MKCSIATISFLLIVNCFCLINAQAQSLKCGDQIVITHVAMGVHLHSHSINYIHPGTSGQQQITGYPGRDNNDIWVIQDCARGQIRNGDQFRLQHQATGMYLHSHGNIPSPISGQQEVTGWTGKDNNDMWRLELQGNGNWTAGKQFRLVHVATNVALHSHNQTGSNIPAGQFEVTGYSGRDANDFWTAVIATDVGEGGSGGLYPGERIFRGDIQRSEVWAKINISRDGKVDYAFSLRNRDQNLGSCAVFYLVLTNANGDIVKSFGGNQSCVEPGTNNRSKEERGTGTMNRNDLSSLGTMQVLVTQGGKISPNLFRGNVSSLSSVVDSCPECAKFLGAASGGY